MAVQELLTFRRRRDQAFHAKVGVFDVGRERIRVLRRERGGEDRQKRRHLHEVIMTDVGARIKIAGHCNGCHRFPG